ncbi:hypothetical protein ACXX9E_28775 [Pseudomonas sp. GNP014]
MNTAQHVAQQGINKDMTLPIRREFVTQHAQGVVDSYSSGQMTR